MWIRGAVLKHKNLMENEYFFLKNHFSTFKESVFKENVEKK